MDPHPSPGSGLHLVSWLLMDVVGCIRLHSLGNETGMARGPLAPPASHLQPSKATPNLWQELAPTQQLGTGKSTGLEPGPLSSCASVSPL